MSLHHQGGHDREYDSLLSSHSQPNISDSLIVTDGPMCKDDSQPASDNQSNAATDNLLGGVVNDDYEAEKHAIYRHALFPLLALLFERCEQATRAPDCVALASLKADIHLFVQHQQQRECKFVSDDPEVDSLMLRAIQTLRIHLLELEKVNELCKDFCSRYIACLRAKMQNEQLLHLDSFDAECAVTGGGGLMSPSATAEWPTTAAAAGASLPPSDSCMPSIIGVKSDARGVSENVDMYSSQVEFANHLSAPLSHHSAGSDGQIAFRSMQDSNMPCTPLNIGIQGHTNSAFLSSLASLDDIEDEELRSSQNKRGMLPRHATQVLKTWLYQHMVHPYPTDDEKRLLASQTCLSILQVNNWFINARRRILPSVESAAPTNQETSPKAKRLKTSSTSHPGTQWPMLGTSPAAAGSSQSRESMEDPSSLSSTPSSTTFECDYGLGDDRSQTLQDPQRFLCNDFRSRNTGNMTRGDPTGPLDDNNHYQMPHGYGGRHELGEAVGSSSDNVDYTCPDITAPATADRGENSI